MLISFLVAFGAGALVEACCVFWVHYSERQRAVPTALCSMLIAAAQVTGIGQSLHAVAAAVGYVLGFGVGTFGAVRFKARRAERAKIEAEPEAEAERRAAEQRARDELECACRHEWRVLSCTVARPVFGGSVKLYGDYATLFADSIYRQQTKDAQGSTTTLVACDKCGARSCYETPGVP